MEWINATYYRTEDLQNIWDLVRQRGAELVSRHKPEVDTLHDEPDTIRVGYYTPSVVPHGIETPNSLPFVRLTGNRLNPKLSIVRRDLLPRTHLETLAETSLGKSLVPRRVVEEIVYQFAELSYDVGPGDFHLVLLRHEDLFCRMSVQINKRAKKGSRNKIKQESVAMQARSAARILREKEYEINLLERRLERLKEERSELASKLGSLKQRLGSGFQLTDEEDSPI